MFGVKECVDSGSPGAEVKFIVGYWRKANAIHKWFVDNVQEGVDECQNSYVERAKLEELRDLCLEVLDKTKVEAGIIRNGWTYDDGGNRKWFTEPGDVIVNPEIAQERLPAQAGFFFGSTDYDESYVSELRTTVENIDQALKLPDCWSYYYHASW